MKMIEKSNFNGDLLGRDVELKNLSMLIEGTTEPLTLAINAAWGAGKTTFVKDLWKPYLETEYGIESFYFSAWENDHSDEPLVSILGEFNSYLSSKYLSDSNEFKEIKSKFIAIGKLAIVQSIKKVTADIVDVSPLIDSYADTKNSAEEFKKQIAKLLAWISSRQENKKTFVIFIDELDRCRPLYAIEFLERIKHLFNIDGLIFVLSIDKTQLAESIKSQYGNIDTDNYLRRFIDLEYQLPQGDIKSFCNAKISEFCLKKLLQRKGVKLNGIGYNHHVDFFYMQVGVFQTQLRAIEQILLRLNIIYKTIEPKLFTEHFMPITFLTFIKHYDSGLFYKFIAGEEKEIMKNLIDIHRTNTKSMGMTCPKLAITISHAIINCVGIADIDMGKVLSSNAPPIKNESSIYYKLLSEPVGGSDSDYKFNNLINTAVKLVEFTDRFTIDNG